MTAMEQSHGGGLGAALGFAGFVVFLVVAATVSVLSGKG